jgi:hypothetical protein
MSGNWLHGSVITSCTRDGERGVTRSARGRPQSSHSFLVAARGEECVGSPVVMRASGSCVAVSGVKMLPLDVPGKPVPGIGAKVKR